MLQYNLELFIIKQDIRKLLDSKKYLLTWNMTKKKLFELEREWKVSVESVQILYIRITVEILLLKLFNNNQ